METPQVLKGNTVPSQEEEAWEDENFREFIQNLPKVRGISGDLYFYQGFWCLSSFLKGVVSFQKHFQALDSDIILVTMPKSGTTWIKALTFSIMNRHRFSFKDHPLLASNPHQLVRFIDCDIYANNPRPNFEIFSHPRIFSTHVPFPSLPASIKDSKTKIVYLCRNPMDVFVSYWQFRDKIRPATMEAMTMEEAFEQFINGMFGFGPFCDHVLGFWKASQEKPNKILFMKYEEIKEDTFFYVKKLANFLGFPFSKEEETQGIIEEIVKICSFDNLKQAEVNKSGYLAEGYPNSAFFRKGKVGDWSNYLTPSMVEGLEKLLQECSAKSGLEFKL